MTTTAKFLPRFNVWHVEQIDANGYRTFGHGATPKAAYRAMQHRARLCAAYVAEKRDKRGKRIISQYD